MRVTAARRTGQAGILSALAACALFLACAWACLPTLQITPPTLQAASACGDGVIEPDAGDGGGEQCDPGPDASPLALQVCKSCEVSCSPDGASSAFVDPQSQHCYFALDQTNTPDIDTAADDCEFYGAHVVRFVSEGEVQLVTSHAPTSPFWIGLRETSLTSSVWLPSEPTSEPGWTQGCAGCFAAVDASAPDGGAIPTGVGVTGTGACVVGDLDPPGWTQSICETRIDGGRFGRLSICEREPVGTRTVPCSQGACFTVAATTKHYVLFGVVADASAAVQACQTLGGQAQLVVFQSPEEREQVGYELGRQTVISDGGGRDYWIGLGSDGGLWTWDGPGGIASPPWALNQPTDGGARAYVIVQPGTLSSELAIVAGPEDEHYPLCQR